MTDKKLRSQLIRLAHAKPVLRAALLPLLKTGGGAAWSNLGIAFEQKAEHDALNILTKVKTFAPDMSPQLASKFVHSATTMVATIRKYLSNPGRYAPQLAKVVEDLITMQGLIKVYRQEKGDPSGIALLFEVLDDFHVDVERAAVSQGVRVVPAW